MRAIYHLAISVVLVFGTNLALAGYSSVLTTKTYKVTITNHCEEGDVNCGNISYIGLNLKTGKVIRLKGHDLIHFCPGDQGDGPGKTPCHHLGYEFKNGVYTYFVSDNGTLQVFRGDKVILEEQGSWGN